MDFDEEIEMTGVMEYSEEYPVTIGITRGAYRFGVPLENRSGFGRLVIQARVEGGFAVTEVDLLHILQWVKINRPILLL